MAKWQTANETAASDRAQLIRLYRRLARGGPLALYTLWLCAMIQV